MPHLLEKLTQEQLLQVIHLLEGDSKSEAIQFIAEQTPLNELQALKVIETIVNENDEVLKQYTQGTPVSEDLAEPETVSLVSASSDLKNEITTEKETIFEPEIDTKTTTETEVLQFPSEPAKAQVESVIEDAPIETPAMMRQSLDKPTTPQPTVPHEVHTQNLMSDQEESKMGMVWMGLGIFVVLLLLIWMIS